MSFSRQGRWPAASRCAPYIGSASSRGVPAAKLQGCAMQVEGGQHMCPSMGTVVISGVTSAGDQLARQPARPPVQHQHEQRRPRWTAADETRPARSPLARPPACLPTAATAGCPLRFRTSPLVLLPVPLLVLTTCGLVSTRPSSISFPSDPQSPQSYVPGRAKHAARN